MCISAMTRYGKTMCVAIGICLFILFNKNKKIALVAPKKEQSEILRNYITSCIFECPLLLSFSDFQLTDKTDRLKKEASKTRMTFKNGCEYRVFSAHGDADRLMGFGASLVICVPKGQKVVTDKGLVDIKDICESSEKINVLSYNHITNQTEYKEVLKKYVNIKNSDVLEIKTNKGKFLVTENHPIYKLNSGYVLAKDLRVLDKIYKYNSINNNYDYCNLLYVPKHIFASSSYRLQQKKQQYGQSNNIMPTLSLQNKLQKRDVEEVIIKSIKKINNTDKYVYNIEVKDNNNFFVNGFLTHNCDEACLISDEARAKIHRMLGDNPVDSIMIDIFNPWGRDNKAYEHWNDPDWHNIHIDYKIALEEGRLTNEFLAEMKKELNPIEFTVLYESNFPQESNDSLFNYQKVMEAVDKEFDNFKVETKIIGVDVATMGLDSTVIMKAYSDNFNYKILEILTEAKSQASPLIGKIRHIAENEFTFCHINIDCIGVGWGITDILKKELKQSIYPVTGCNFANSAPDSKRFKNIKAYMYFRLSKLFNEGRISIPNNKTLIRELLSMKFEYKDGKMIIIDPDKSPDFADALVYTVWENSKINKGFHIK